MWTIIKYYILTKNNLFMLVMIYPMFLFLSKMGGVHIAPAMSNIDIVVYPFLYFGFFVNTDKAALERLPIDSKRIKTARGSALYMIILFLMALDVILLNVINDFSPERISTSFLRIDILFVLAMLFSKYLFKNYIDVKTKDIILIPLQAIPLIVLLVSYLFIFEDNHILQIILNIVFYPLYEFWDYYIFNKSLIRKK